MTEPDTCPTCGRPMEDCPECEGTGEWKGHTWECGGQPGINCPRCNGTGRVPAKENTDG